MKNLLKSLKLWDVICITLVLNAILSLIIFICIKDEPTNNDVIQSMVHCLLLVYTYKYFTTRKSYY